MSPSPGPSAPRPALPKVRLPFHGTVRIVASLVLFVLGPISWFSTIDDAELRSTGATVWACYVSGLYLGATAAWKDKRRWIRLVFAGELLFVALSVAMFYFGARLPAAAPRPASAPDFTLTDSEGNAITLSSELARGPVLLFFTRGHW